MRTALVVEDDEISMRVFGVALQRRGFRVLQARSAQEALELFRPRAFDITICDVRLPVTSGPQLALQLAAFRPRVRVLFSSGTPVEGWAETDRDCLAAMKGRVIHAFLSKPFRIETLDAMVDELLKRGRFLRRGNRRASSKLLDSWA
ncbi:MAG TPA: response regulator [Tepidisphaeraceae bacterium]|nr:response regulator [Tepidisphaeraceae bacterium]